jgi:hypothetical protein
LENTLTRLADIKTLESLYIETGMLISAAEGYPKQYRRAPKQYSQLLRAEQKFGLSLRQYFQGLPTRLVKKVNWQQYQSEVMAYDIEVDFNAQDWQSEQDLLLLASYPSMLDAATAGANAADVIYGTGELPTDAYIQQAVADHALKLVKGLTDTTKADVQRSIETSLKLHETYDDAASRLNDVLDSEYRAEMISRTETVRAYQRGVLDYGINSGAVSKTWQVSSNPCNICEPMIDQTVLINEAFSGGEDAPPQHPSCRCGIMLNYQADSVPVDDFSII